MNTLVVVAHPDDEVLGCGGTIARLSQYGDNIFIAILGEGITSRYDQRASAAIDLIEILHDQSRQVANMIGAQDVFFYSLPDNRFDILPLLDIIKIIENLIANLRPEVIFTHHSGDLNIDHVITHRAVLTATRPVQQQSVKDIYAFEIPSSTEWTFHQFTPVFKPNVFINITDTLQLKINAMAQYESEASVFPHPRSSEALNSIARRWGSVVGCPAAEAFELIRSIR